MHTHAHLNAFKCTPTCTHTHVEFPAVRMCREACVTLVTFRTAVLLFTVNNNTVHTTTVFCWYS